MTEPFSVSKTSWHLPQVQAAPKQLGQGAHPVPELATDVAALDDEAVEAAVVEAAAVDVVEPVADEAPVEPTVCADVEADDDVPPAPPPDGAGCDQSPMPMICAHPGTAAVTTARDNAKR